MSQLQWFKTQEKDGKTVVFDPIRKRYCVLTPEEEVRQKALYLLVEQLSIPQGLVAVEYSVKVNGLDKRCDAVVFAADGHPLMILECKAATVKISQKTLDQAIRYHSALHPDYLMLYNGTQCFCFKVTETGLLSMNHLPTYEEMTR